MPHQKIKEVSITQADATHLGSVVERTCTHTGLPKEGYLNIFFEMGCEAVELVYKDNKKVQLDILSNINYGFWGWFMVEYIKHDEDLHNSNVPYRNYAACKKLWLGTFKLYESLSNFISYKFL